MSIGFFIKRNGLLINPQFYQLLSRYNLIDYDTILNYEKNQVIKSTKKKRTIYKLHLLSEDPPHSFYLKHYKAPTLKDLIKSFLQLEKPKTALVELNNIIMFHFLGIPTSIPVMAGIKRGFLYWGDSLLLTEALLDTVPVDQFIKEKYTPPIDLKGLIQKRRLIYKIAELTRKMHNEGICHRDLYLCHILIIEKDSRDIDLFIMDLHRVFRPRWKRIRWIVKDLASLYYSSPREAITNTDYIRFLKHYFGTEKLTKTHKELIKKIIKKEKKIRAHDIKRLSR